MRPYDTTTGTFELIIFADESNKDAAPVFHNLPGENPFYTKDLFTQHPTKPKLFKYYGRRDDILVLANGEKFNPIPSEHLVGADAALKGVLLTGNGRTQPALVVEPRDALDEAGRAELLEKLWPRIEEANSQMPSHGRVARGMVICAKPEKPFARTGKGTIVRKLTQADYQDEIDLLYTDSGRERRLVMVPLKAKQKTVYEDADVVAFLRQVLAVSFPPASTISESEDFFSHGLDSIQTLEIIATLKHSLKDLSSSSLEWLAPRVIFQHSTLASLSKVLGAFLNDGAVPAEDAPANRAKALDDAVTRYVKDLPSKSAVEPGTSSEKESGKTIAIIGSTGYVGSHLVATLLKSPGIARIYCLNRGSDVAASKQKTLSKLDADIALSSKSPIFLQVTLGAPRLGLSEEQYQTIVNEVDTVVYNAWRLDFGLALHSFDPFLHATRDLIDLSLSSQKGLRIVFVSSTSSVGALMATGKAIPEAPVDDALAALSTGYGQSKLAAERILATAARQCGVPVSIVRVGQVGGLSQGKGVWADQPWISAIVRSSKAVGSFPGSVMPIDWVPVDKLAAVFESVILQPTKNGQQFQFYNVVSEAQPWTLLLEALPKEYGQETSRVVPLPEWVSEVRKLWESGATDIADLPAARVVDFYTTLGSGIETVDYETANTEAITGQKLGPVTREMLASWLKTWGI